MKIGILSLLILLSGFVQASELVIRDTWIRAMPPSSRVVPIYLIIDNPTSASRKLINITSSAGSIEMHQTIEHNGVMSMAPINDIVIKANGQVTLAPSGLHGMMSHFSHGVPVLGDIVPLTLTFADGEKLEVEATVNKQAFVKAATMVH